MDIQLTEEERSKVLDIFSRPTLSSAEFDSMSRDMQLCFAKEFLRRSNELHKKRLEQSRIRKLFEATIGSGKKTS